MMVHFAPTRIDDLADDVALLFMQHMIRLHGCPAAVVFGRRHTVREPLLESGHGTMRH